MANSDGKVTISVQVAIDEVTKQIKKIKDKFASLSETRTQIAELTQSIEMQKQRIQTLNLELARMVALGQGVPANLEKELSQETAALKRLEEALAVLKGDGTKATKTMSQGFKDLGKRIMSTLKSALLFSALYKAAKQFADLMKNVLLSDEEFKQDWEELKAALYAVAQPLINILVPALRVVVGIVRDWVVAIGHVVALIQGMTYAELVNQAKASKEMADNYADAEKSTKKMSKTLAGFDDLQKISSSETETETEDKYSGFESLAGAEDGSEAISTLEAIMTVLGGALAAVGIVLLLKGHVAWGVGFLVAGAFVWAITEIWGDEEFDPNEPKQVFDKIMESIEVALAAIGIILLIKGLTWWGLGFLAAGAVVFGVKEIVANWDDIVATVRDIFQQFGGIIAAAGAALIIIGIILCCTGVGIPLGIGLIIAGAASIVGAVAFNSDAIVDWFKGLWGKVQEFWNTHVKKIFTSDFWLNLAKECGNGLIWGFEAAINGIISIFEEMINLVVSGLNKISFDVPDWVPGIGGKKFGFNLPYASLERVSLPRLAQGAVIPANREFLAVLGDQKHGTNIETPLQTMVDAFNIALNQRQGDSPMEVVLEIDGREFGRAVVEQGSRENRRIGTKLVVV